MFLSMKGDGKSPCTAANAQISVDRVGNYCDPRSGAFHSPCIQPPGLEVCPIESLGSQPKGFNTAWQKIGQEALNQPQEQQNMLRQLRQQLWRQHQLQHQGADMQQQQQQQ
eukprot:CAMPEP_0206429772 /NCGR_PEP_ID=MMETSP0324_2-20121206/6429_1 /ASSEMBLY_ACC=CAM_ASM_000836 /TAXON_ID=2866 /ORGANISM="Crypthecodinium cohnii, Strain Seligo" /LENGTH=110 /DNA_ID=CAMNT_0053895495 /DNA_START=49 /DNA_END=378 /DNA_ORIENTATION=-